MRTKRSLAARQTCICSLQRDNGKKVTFNIKRFILALLAAAPSPTFLHELMRPAYEFEIVFMHEFVGDLGPEQPACATRADRPVLNLLRVRPDEVAECA